MPASITAQASSSGGGPPNFPSVEEALKKLAAALVKQAADNLAQTGHVASGALAKSIVARELEITGGKMQIDIEALDYLQFINKGVRGTKGGQGLFVFKSQFPSQAMVTSVAKWMGTKGLTVMAASKNTGRLKRTKASITQASGAYAIARSILQHGIKPTGFFDMAADAVQQQAQEILGTALKADIINALPATLG